MSAFFVRVLSLRYGGNRDQKQRKKKQEDNLDKEENVHTETDSPSFFLLALFVTSV